MISVFNCYGTNIGQKSGGIVQIGKIGLHTSADLQDWTCNNQIINDLYVFDYRVKFDK